MPPRKVWWEGRHAGEQAGPAGVRREQKEKPPEGEWVNWTSVSLRSRYLAHVFTKIRKL